jgi:hypothetical protein
VIALRVEPVGEKHIRISGINPVVLDCLHALPEILEQRDSPIVRPRLFPDPMPSDQKANAEWQRLIGPELRHLFASAGEIVVRDLTALSPDPDSDQLCALTFPAEHMKAWMSTLNEARLIMGEQFQVAEEDMSAADFDVCTPKGLAVFRIHVLGYLLQLFIELESGDEPETNL